MININGEITSESVAVQSAYRGYLHGDVVRETLRINDGNILLLEGHYFRLMASMRIMRMPIPMNFTIEYFAEQITKTITAYKRSPLVSAVTVLVFRNSTDLTRAEPKDIEFLITTSEVDKRFGLGTPILEITVFKDHRVNKGMLSSITERSGIVGKLAGIFASENNFDDSIVLNTDGHIAGTSGGNIFMIKDESVYTPGVGEGISNTVYRREIVKKIKVWTGMDVVEKPLSAYDISTAREVFIVDIKTGVRNVLRFRKTKFQTVQTDGIRKHFWEMISNLS